MKRIGISKDFVGKEEGSKETVKEKWKQAESDNFVNIGNTNNNHVHGKKCNNAERETKRQGGS